MEQLKLWAIDRLIEYENNPRKHNVNNAVDRVAAAIMEFGFRVPILARSDGTIIDGHLRLKAARKLGVKEVPVMIADDMTDLQVKAFRLSVNKMAEMAEWDKDLLDVALAELEELNFDMVPFGFDIAEEDVQLPKSFLTRPYDKLHFLATVDIGDMEQLRELEEMCIKKGIEYETMGN